MQQSSKLDKDFVETPLKFHPLSQIFMTHTSNNSKAKLSDQIIAVFRQNCKYLYFLVLTNNGTTSR